MFVKVLSPTLALRNRTWSKISPCVRLKFSTDIKRNDSNILYSPHKKLDIPQITIPELIFSAMSKWDSLVATECVITGRKYTHRDIRKCANNLAGNLAKKLKLQKGDTVAIILPNCPEYAPIVLGILQGGFVATTVNPIYTSEEISRQLIDSETKAIITFTDSYQLVKKAADATQKQIPVLTAKTEENQATPDGAINLFEFFQEKVDISDIPKANYDDVACLPYSSGTTGLPKGVELTHINLVSNLLQVGVPELNFFQSATDNHQDNFPAILPQFHIYGLSGKTFLPLLYGARCLIFPRFEPKPFIEILAKRQADILFVAPPLVLFMLAQEAVKPDYFTSVRNIVCGAAPLGESDEKIFMTKINQKRQTELFISQAYGMTETCPAVTLGYAKKKLPNGCSGPPIPNTELKIVSLEDPKGPALGCRESGEVLVRGPQVMKGYHKKETENVFVDGWLRTGDAGYYDEDGCLFVNDRIKELIKVKGFQVAPAEIEDIVRAYPGILDVGVVGIPHERLGEAPRAYVVMKPGCQLKEEELHKYLRGKVASYKQLEGGVKIIDSIPKNTTGKILRRKLLDL